MQAIDQVRVFIHPDGRMDRKNTALYVGNAPKTLADWATKGIGPPYFLVGGRAFYFKQDLDEWIASRPRTPGSARPVSVLGDTGKNRNQPSLSSQERVRTPKKRPADIPENSTVSQSGDATADAE